MRANTLISLGIAVVLALMAVFGVRTWLNSQRAELMASAQTQLAKSPKHFVVVAKSNLRFGERLTVEKLELLEWANDRIPDGAFTEIEPLVGASDEEARYVLSSITSGEMILPSKITSPGQRAKLSTAISPGMKAVSIRVNDVLGVAGFVLPGDRVDVMLTRENRNNNEEPYVDVLLQGVRVVAIDQIADDRKDQPSVVRTVTFEVTTEEAQKLMLGSTIGTLSLALRNIVSTGFEAAERVTMTDLDSADSAGREEAQAAAREAAMKASEEARLAAEQREREQLERLNALEATIKSIGTEVVEKLDSVQQGQEKSSTAADVASEAVAPEPIVIEKEVIVEKIVEVAPPPPEFVNVGVVRGGQRAEYRVNSTVVATPAGEAVTPTE